MVLGIKRIIRELGAGELGARLEDGVTGIGDQHNIARIEQGERKVPHALLGTVDRADHIRRYPINVKTAFVVVAHRLLHLRQIAQAVLPHLGIARSIDERVNDMIIRSEIGCSHG